jgi:hypothetical protein
MQSLLAVRAACAFVVENFQPQNLKVLSWRRFWGSGQAGSPKRCYFRRDLIGSFPGPPIRVMQAFRKLINTGARTHKKGNKCRNATNVRI